jgi:hypothetical protein
MYLGEEIVELSQDGLDITGKGNLGAYGIVQLFGRDLHLIKKSVMSRKDSRGSHKSRAPHVNELDVLVVARSLAKVQNPVQPGACEKRKTPRASDEARLSVNRVEVEGYRGGG